MATDRSFSDMLNEHLTNRMLNEELLERSYVWQKMTKEQGWKGGNLPVPFRGNRATSIAFGALPASNDISQYDYVRGNISTYKELWGALKFNHADLQEHNGKIPETTFLRILDEQVDFFMDYVKEATSRNITTGAQFAMATDSTNAATGVFVVDNIDTFEIQQKCVIDDDDTGPADAYVIAINLNTSEVTLSDSRGGAAFNFSAYTTAQNAKFYHPGAQTGGFISLRSALLSAANGGSSTLHGVSKLAWPHLQAINVDGGVSGLAITASNILDSLFDAYSQIRQKARGNANTILMSFKHLGSVMKQIELQKGAFMVSKQPKASQYGWTEIELVSVKGALTLVGIQEMDDDIIFFLDWDSFKFVSNGLFKKRVSPDGLEYFEERATTGYTYIVDISLWGELMVMKPNSNGVIYGISY